MVRKKQVMRNLILFPIFFVPMILLGQVKSPLNYVSAEYDRNSVTCLLLGLKGEVIDEKFKKVFFKNKSQSKILR